MPPLRILLVDDHILFRKGLASLLDSQPDFDVVGEANDGLEGLERAKALKPDLILMDVTMPRCSGPEATRLITQQLRGAQVVMLTVSDDDVDLFAAIRAGAMGYLLKSMKPDELFTHLRGLAHGEAPISRLMAAKLLREFARSRSEPPMPPLHTSTVLTDREQEVLSLIARGLTNREIGEKLHIAENTVKNHVRSILDKLHLANRAQAAAYAVQVQMRTD
ncbi:MAG: response regulator transcription factor [Thermoflexales bacterium]|nr:response regulator transcription factor [Thermoflexales bacterium]